MPPLDKKRRYAVGWLLPLGVLLLAWNVRVIDIQEHKVMAWAWQGGEVHFINSVTRRPVRITFELRRPFSHFVMTTDPDTEGYYTGGAYRINQRLRGQQLNELNYCSVVGMTLRMGEKTWSIKQDCLTARVVWPPPKTLH